MIPDYVVDALLEKIKRGDRIIVFPPPIHTRQDALAIDQAAMALLVADEVEYQRWAAEYREQVVEAAERVYDDYGQDWMTEES